MSPRVRPSLLWLLVSLSLLSVRLLDMLFHTPNFPFFSLISFCSLVRS